MVYRTTTATCFALAIGVGAAQAAGDFPAASCKGWDGTVVERNGTGSAHASMRGIITKGDMEEYCDRDPGLITKAFGGKLTRAQCVGRYLAQESRTRLVAEANCRTGRSSYRYGSREQITAKFPLAANADTSCASGMPPLIAQFEALCPAAASRMHLPE